MLNNKYKLSEVHLQCVTLTTNFYLPFMLESLSIRNIVLIDTLHIDFDAGLCVLTGETGAGKSILLDALGLALGVRAEAGLLKQGAASAHVIAVFALPPLHPFWQKLNTHGISHEGREIIFRRLLEADGKSKCFLNDHLISQTLMRRLGQDLVEIHGQFDQLRDTKSYLDALDAYGKVEKKQVQEAFKAYQDAKETRKAFQENLAHALERQTFLNFAIEEIEKAAPQIGEELKLESERALIAHHAKIAETLSLVNQSLAPTLAGLSQSYKDLSRIEDLLPEKIQPLLQTADRAMIETQEVMEGMKALSAEVEGTQHSLETLENRLYTLRSLSRKYQTEDLSMRLAAFKQERSVLDQKEGHLEALEASVIAAKTIYFEHARTLSETRKQAAMTLQRALVQELPSLKLGHATFRVDVKELSEEAWGPAGMNRVEFYVQMNSGVPEGSLATIASGGELSRLMLALKVVLAQSGAVPTLIFDEIESGTGGAVTSAMGERLKILSEKIQILAITHSPQIASYGTQHLVVFKVMEEKGTTTYVKTLGQEERYEEVARMLAGEKITEEARAAAKSLMI